MQNVTLAGQKQSNGKKSLIALRNIEGSVGKWVKLRIKFEFWVKINDFSRLEEKQSVQLFKWLDAYCKVKLVDRHTNGGT